MKHLLLATAALALAAPAHAEGFLHARDQQIVDGAGRPVLLRGMGLGGWMLQEGYMLKAGGLPQHAIKAKIADLIGPQKTEAFYQAWRDNEVTKADIDAMASWGFNSIRLPMHWNLFMEDAPGKIVWKPEGFAMIDRLIAWCKANDMVIILDLHAAPGGQGNDLPISDRDPAKPSLWQSPDDQTNMIALWRELARRYHDEPSIGGFDLLNEPNWGFEDKADKNGCKETQNAPLRDLYVRTIKAVREEDANHLIIIEGNCWGNNYKGLMPPMDANLALSFHKYWNYTTQDTIANFVAMRATYNVPLWNGESGENSNDWFTHAIRLEEDNGIGWSWWPLKKIGINNPLEIRPNADYMKVSAWLSGEGPRPDSATAERGLMTLATQDIRFEHNPAHPDVIDAMFRAVHSDMAVPFAPHQVGPEGAVIRAADYDLGPDGVAYHDTVAGNYYISTGGAQTSGNDGGAYRNDGVDIVNTPDGPVVTQVQAGEWLHYTLDVAKAGRYVVTVAASDPSAFAVETDHAPAAGMADLQAGRNVLVVRAVKDADSLSGLRLTPLAQP
jgi:hypothetical protein